MPKTKSFGLVCAWVVLLALAAPGPAYAMHIMEGFLPPAWCGLWYLLILPAFTLGLVSISKLARRDPKLKMLLAFVAAFAFTLSALKIPSLTGSCSHPTGVGLGAILFGPAVMTVLGSIVLLFQSLLLAHGGITTLGANAFSMALAGPLAAYGIYRAGRYLGIKLQVVVFAAAALGNLVTYVVTSFQLALAFPDAMGGIAASFGKFASIFAVTQLPLAASEGLLTVLVFNLITANSRNDLIDLHVIPGEVKPHEKANYV